VVLPSLSSLTLVAYATNVLATELVCSQCGREAPADRKELTAWRHGDFALETDGKIDEGLLLCPDCDAADREREFEEGEGG